jgi:hypothetical protein
MSEHQERAARERGCEEQFCGLIFLWSHAAGVADQKSAGLDKKVVQLSTQSKNPYRSFLLTTGDCLVVIFASMLAISRASASTTCLRGRLEASR